MNSKLEYITRFFQKTNYKPLENYCLTRLWHKLDNDEVKLVPQQYVKRHTDKYALTDIYLPQFKIHIEVNEPAHYDSPERIQADQTRKLEIEKQTGHRLFVIDCRKSLVQIHEEIDSIVSLINKEISEQKRKKVFKPWQPDLEQSPNYWKDKKNIRESDDICLKSIDDICALFGADSNKTRRGFLRSGEVSYPRGENYIIWWPKAKNSSGWLNTLEDNDDMIVESHSDIVKIKNHFNTKIQTTELRIVFFHNEDILGNIGYKFKGIYDLDRIESNSNNGLVWKRVSKEFTIL